MAQRRVAITGIGIISALGLDLEQNWSALREGRSGIRPIEGVDFHNLVLRFQNGAQVSGFDPTKYFDPGKEDYVDRFAQFSVVAARHAMRDSGLELSPKLREQCAVVCGSAVGGHRMLISESRDRTGLPPGARWRR
jgi:3-oxoacyl-(acyl-carrier-protein) synthase